MYFTVLLYMVIYSLERSTQKKVSYYLQNKSDLKGLLTDYRTNGQNCLQSRSANADLRCAILYIDLCEVKLL